MEQFGITISVSKSDINLKVIQRNYRGTLSSLVAVLKEVKEETNDYLTELVEKDKEICQRISKADIEMNLDDFNIEQCSDSDEDLKDYIGTEIRKDLSISQCSSGSDGLSENAKRIKTNLREDEKFKK